jgi:hypothetical protein
MKVSRQKSDYMVGGTDCGPEEALLRLWEFLYLNVDLATQQHVEVH